MRAKEALSNAATAVMVLCAVAVTAMAARQQFFPSNAPGQSEAPRSIRNWKSLAKEGNVIGRADAAVTVVEFSDFQCPFCAQLSRTMRAMQARDPARFRVVYRHYPLAQHTYAEEAAIAAECAGRQGRFAEYHDALFAGQDSIGSRAWTGFGVEAGVTDTTALKRCMTEPAVRAQVDRDARQAAKLRLPGTPSLIVDGKLYSGVITESDLAALVSARD